MRWFPPPILPYNVSPLGAFKVLERVKKEQNQPYKPIQLYIICDQENFINFMDTGFLMIPEKSGAAIYSRSAEYA